MNALGTKKVRFLFRPSDFVLNLNILYNVTIDKTGTCNCKKLNIKNYDALCAKCMQIFLLDASVRYETEVRLGMGYFKYAFFLTDF